MNIELARNMHKRQPMVISHLDLGEELQMRREVGERDILNRRYINRFRASGVRVLVSAIYLPRYYLPEKGLSMALEQIAAIYEEADDSNGNFRVVRSASELDSVLSDPDTVALLLSLEGSEPLGVSLGLLRIFYEAGVRLMGLTWNNRTFAADGCAIQGFGLTPNGKKLALRAWELGMILDVSHINDAGFDDILALGDGPVIASHSNCRALCPHLRNLTDNQIIRLSGRGGVIGINQVRSLARQPGSEGTLEDLCAHVLHIEKLSGAGHTGLGLDMLADCSLAAPQRKSYWDTWTPGINDILKDYTDLTILTAMLLECGMDENSVRGFIGGNFLNLLRRALP